MTKKIAMFLVTAALLMGLSGFALAADIPQKVIVAAESVFLIETVDTQYGTAGTAFIVRNTPDGVYLVTNNHVISLNLKNVSVWIGEKEKVSAEVVKNDEKYDLALIKISASIDAGPMMFSKSAERGQGVYAIGFPGAADILSDSTAHLGKDATITDGVISNIRTLQFVEFGPEISVLQINAAINPGNSGGPLVDKNGDVVGINTLGVSDAQGIFGAISTADLEEFMNGTGIALSYAPIQALPFFVWIIVIAGAAIAAAFVLILLLRKRKHARMKNPKIDFCAGMPLGAYLEQYNGHLNPRTVTSLMMPVGLALRDKHMQGELFLKLSPKYIKVTDTGCVLDDSTADDGFLQQRFLSPEQLTGGLAGVYSDIYSFCAILDFMLSKAAFSSVSPPEAAAFRSILERGMSAEPKERHGSMQDLIYALSPFNSGLTPELFVPSPARPVFAAAAPSGPFQNAAYPVAMIDKTGSIYPAGADVPFPETAAAAAAAAAAVAASTAAEPPQPKRKKRRRALTISLISAAVVIAAALTYGGVNYYLARVSIGRHDFSAADRYLRNMAVGKLLAPGDMAYVDAGMKMISHEYDEAISAFTALGSAYDAPTMVKESRYQKAAFTAEQGKYDDAIRLYEELNDYKDSLKLAGDVIVQKGYYLIGEKSYKEAISTFQLLKDRNYEGYEDVLRDAKYQCASSLMADNNYFLAYDYLYGALGYRDADELLATVKKTLYSKAVDLYQNESYASAVNYFNKIQGYERSDDYILLCNAHNSLDPLSEDMVWNKLVPLIGFEDAVDLILKDYDTAEIFLKGTWKGDGYTFIMDKKGGIQTDIPFDRFGEYADIYYGAYYLFDNELSEKSILWLFVPLSADSMDVFDGRIDKIYRLYRQ